MRARRALLLAALALALAWLGRPIALPDPVQAPRVLDRDGLLLAERAAPDRAPGRWVETPPAVLVDALLSAEDHRFFWHPGVDPLAVLRAALANLRAGRVVQGGSTLTQQLARTLWPRPPGLRGKLAEAGLALRLELWHSKATLLKEYLNRIYFGELCYGADAASRHFFDKPARALSLHEAALLAALPRRPAELDPWRNPTGARAARDRVLDRMAALGRAEAEEVALAKAQPLGLRADAPRGEALHFVRRVATEGSGDRLTTLDLGLQREVQRAAARTVARLASKGVGQAAVIVVDLRTREVLAYVGSAGWALPDGQVDGVMAPRSPGSALKPFAYLLALERGPEAGGITLATPLADLPGHWATTHGTWSPTNYDERFHGPVSARRALATSLNLPAVRVLERVGVASLHRRLLDLGLSTLDERPDHYGLGLVLGDGEVRLDELTNAYATLARGGAHAPLRFTRDAPRTPPVQRGDALAAWLIVEALDDADARAPAFGAAGVLEPPFDLAAKTGTSVGWRDNWAIGVSPEVAVGVWVGNFDGAPMVEVSGITGAGPLLAEVLALAHRGERDRFVREDFDPEGRLVTARVCPLSGDRAGPACPGARTERFLPGTRPRATCGWHQRVALDDTGALATGCPGAHEALVVAWPPAYAAWAAEAGQPRWPDEDRSCAPRPAPPAEGPAGIASPGDGLTFWLDADRPAAHQAIPLRAAAPPGAREARWWVDDTLLAVVGPPFEARWPLTPGGHTIALDLDGQRVGTVRVHVGSSDP